MENTDLVTEFFNIDNQPDTNVAMPTVSASEIVDNAYDEIEPVLTKAGVSKEDSDYVYMSIKDSLEGLLINDDGTTCEPSDVIGEFTAEVTDTLSFVLPDMPAEEIANLASDIVSAVNKPVEYDFDYEADLPGPVESEIMDEIENNDRTPEIDTESNDDLDPTFWD